MAVEQWTILIIYKHIQRQDYIVSFQAYVKLCIIHNLKCMAQNKFLFQIK